MSNIGTGAIKLNGLNLKPDINNTEQPQSIQLKGINFTGPVNNPVNQNPNPNWNNDGTRISPQNYGNVPANDNLPPMFSGNSTGTKPAVKKVSQEGVVVNTTPPSKDEGLATGIGMAIGAVGGALIGRSLGAIKIGIGLGVIGGGVIGHFFEK